MLDEPGLTLYLLAQKKDLSLRHLWLILIIWTYIDVSGKTVASADLRVAERLKGKIIRAPYKINTLCFSELFNLIANRLIIYNDIIKFFLGILGFGQEKA